MVVKIGKKKFQKGRKNGSSPRLGLQMKPKQVDPKKQNKKMNELNQPTTTTTTTKNEIKRHLRLRPAIVLRNGCVWVLRIVIGSFFFFLVSLLGWVDLRLWLINLKKKNKEKKRISFDGSCS